MVMKTNAQLSKEASADRIQEIKMQQLDKWNVNRVIDPQTQSKLHRFVETGPIRERTDRFKEVSHDMKEAIKMVVEQKRESN
jgi:hypothetical protein